MNTQELYQKAIVFVTKKHMGKGQTVPDSYKNSKTVSL